MLHKVRFFIQKYKNFFFLASFLANFQKLSTSEKAVNYKYISFYTPLLLSFSLACPAGD